MNYQEILCICLLFYSAAIFKESASNENLRVSENNGSSVFIQMLRGRDGLPGRDGSQGLAGPMGLPGPAGPPGPQSGGAIYTRWGKSSCPDATDTEMVYSGIAGGTFWNQPGGGANYLCMPKIPEYTLQYRGTSDGHARVYGVEYEQPIRGSYQHNAPCAVCTVSSRPTMLMIPAKTTCPPTWTREYYGYLMTQYHGTLHHRTMFVCVDESPESIPGSHRNTNGAVFYHVEADCSTDIPCPPYNDYKELTCVVCTK